MQRIIDGKLNHLKQELLVMGGYVEQSLASAVAALLSRDLKKFSEVHDIEKKINEGHIKIDELCLSLIAKEGPVAKDLRLIVSTLKICTDLERMGDLAVSIAYNGKDYLRYPALDQIRMIMQMSTQVRLMVKESLDSFVKEDIELAKRILIIDDEVDQYKRTILDELTSLMKLNPGNIDAALFLIAVARNLERLGDHATNIAEDVIYVSTGRDIRHGGKIG